MVDEALILRKLAELDQYYSQLKEYENTTADQYSDDWKIQRIIERTLQMMIETCADIAGHIIADKGSHGLCQLQGSNYSIPGKG